MKTRLSEMDLAGAVVGWLREQHWDVYQEVACRGSICDIVAVQGPVLWAIECKVSMGLAVLGQGLHWLDCANLISVATGRVVERGAAMRIAKEFGLGIFTVPREGAQVLVDPVLRRRVAPSLRDALREEQKTYAHAGGQRYWTPFQATCKAVSDFVRLKPGSTMREVVDGIRHHYGTPASARQHLTRWIEAGKVPGVVVRREGRRVLVELAS